MAHNLYAIHVLCGKIEPQLSLTDATTPDDIRQWYCAAWMNLSKDYIWC